MLTEILIIKNLFNKIHYGLQICEINLQHCLSLRY